MSRRRRGGGAHVEETNLERWTTSYMDMVTVMMCLFIVLYAISSVDQQKFEQLRDSLSVSFGLDAHDGLLDGSTGVLAADALPAPAGDRAEGTRMVAAEQLPATLDAGRQEVAELSALHRSLEAELAARDVPEDVTLTIDDRGLTISLVGADVFFSVESAELTAVSERVIDAVAPVLRDTPHQLTVEGHANNLPTSRYPTNWELSADRATKVLRRMVEVGHIPGERIRAVGLGDAHPLAASSGDPLTVNRRVDIVVLSDAPEAVRRLIPELLAGRDAALTEGAALG